MSDQQQPGKRRFRDVVWVLLACAILGTVFRSSLVFLVASIFFVLLYMIGGPVVKRQRQ